MWLIDKLAEQHIKEAMERGELDNLPGAGRPLNLEDDALVPEELRAGFRLLRNAGYLPPELQLAREIAEVEELIRLAEDSGTRQRAERRLQVLELRLSESRGGRVDLHAEQTYRSRLRRAMSSAKLQGSGLDSEKGLAEGDCNECPAGDGGTQPGRE